VTVLTVLACDPDSRAPTRGWDARSGFATEGEAARARRLEDAAACAVLGAEPRWLRFGSVDYERHGADDDVAAAVADAAADSTALLLPGAPLSHPDHAWLVQVLARTALRGRRLGLYGEQPYLARAAGPSSGREVPTWLRQALGGGRLRLVRTPAAPRDWLAKRRAVRCYRSQLPLLALAGAATARLERHLLSEVRAGGERLWVGEGGAEGSP
jgi:LmbE family N-acetylglucosaminyl deacetylase